MTLPVGRFLLDLPGDARIFFGRQGFRGAGPFIRAVPGLAPALAEECMVAQARALAVPHEEGGARLERVVAGAAPHSWFLFYWKDTVCKGETLEVNGYFWLDGRVFIFRNRCPAGAAGMAERVREMETVFATLRRRSALEIPLEPAFCVKDGYFLGGPAPHSREHVEVLAAFPSQRDLLVRLGTATVGETAANAARPMAAHAHWLRAKARTLRGHAGEERVQAVAAEGGAHSLHFLWECPGRAGESLAPLIRLELKTGWGRPAPGRSTLGANEAFTLWEALHGSLRQAPAQQPETRSALGTSA